MEFGGLSLSASGCSRTRSGQSVILPITGPPVCQLQSPERQSGPVRTVWNLSLGDALPPADTRLPGFSFSHPETWSGAELGYSSFSVHCFNSERDGLREGAQTSLQQNGFISALTVAAVFSHPLPSAPWL